MPKAGSTEPITIERRSSSGAVVPSKVQADFSFPAWLDGVPTVLTIADFDEISAGKYVVSMVMPATLGRLRIDLNATNPTTDVIEPAVLEGRIFANDIDSVAILAARPPSITMARNIAANADYTIEVYKGDGRTITVPIYDDNGDLIDLSLWENFKFSIKNEDQIAVPGSLPYDLASGATGGADGMLDIPIPENCSAYGMLTAGEQSVVLYWSAEANPIGNTAGTRTLRGGRFIVRWKQTP